jgi:hypothetical protein
MLSAECTAEGTVDGDCSKSCAWSEWVTPRWIEVLDVLNDVFDNGIPGEQASTVLDAA